MLLGLGGLLLLLVILVAVEFVFTRGDTPPIVDSSGEPLPGSVASLERLQIGGAEQYVLIRGHDQNKPVLLFLHGGPGMPAMYLAHAFQRELERDFVVVHWDRRGAGKSYHALPPTDTPTVRQTLEDTYELTRHLRQRFGQDKIYLVGHSWGTYLGLLAANERPEYYRAYVGMGQMSADTARTYAVMRDFVLRAATAAGDSAVVAWIRSGGNANEDDLFRYGAELYAERSFWPILRLGLEAPEYTLFDVLNVPRGAQRLNRIMRYDVIDGSRDREVLRFEIPIAFFLGRHDFNTPSVLAEEYLQNIDAPLKRLVWFEEAAHFPFLEEPERFHSELLRLHQTLNSTPLEANQES